MYVTFNDLRGFALMSGEEEIGHVHDAYVDDRSWVANYLVVETGGWFSSHKILLDSPNVVSLDLDRNHLATSLSKEALENAPPASSRETVPQANERVWLLEPSHHVYLAGPHGAVLPPSLYGEMIEMDRDSAAETGEGMERHLRSGNEIIGYAISASDGEIGSISDLIIDPSDWRVAYFCVDTGNWLPGKLVILPPKLAEAISWEERSVSFAMTKQQIEESPPLASLNELERSHEELTYAHYGYPVM